MARICEFFTSIQGEGKRVGIPSLFIRSYGCNLCCKGFGQPDPADEHDQLCPRKTRAVFRQGSEKGGAVR